MSKDQKGDFNPERTLHDPNLYWDIKMKKSTTFFKGTRIYTCSHIKMRNGKAVAVPFPLKKPAWKNSSEN